MPTKLLKEVIDTVLPIITKIINSSLEQGTFAARWKTAVIRSLIKKAGLDLTTNNYRPVRNLSFLSKVLEKAVLIQLMKHCKKNLIPDYQSAYTPHYSCETALVKLVNELLWAMEYQEVTALMAIDLSAALDTVDHDILVSVLEAKFGIEGQALNWFDSYLRQRCYKVNVCQAYSEPKYLPFSVPQGSCAGPVLYILYASTMQEVIEKNVDLHVYANDHALTIKFVPTKNENIAVSTLEKCSKEIMSWMDSNRLNMNTSKMEFILSGSNHQLKKCQTNHLLVDKDNIQKSTKIKYLGVYLDENLTLKEQIKMKCKSAM
jgi:Reverse transcriptase (RNA-dependent DNA polymerase)